MSGEEGEGRRRGGKEEGRKNEGGGGEGEGEGGREKSVTLFQLNSVISSPLCKTGVYYI